MWLAQMLGISLQQHQWVSELQVWGHRAAKCSGLSISVWHRGTIEARGGEGGQKQHWEGLIQSRGRRGLLLPLVFTHIISFGGCRCAFVVGICVPSSRGSPPAAACCKYTPFCCFPFLNGCIYLNVGMLKYPPLTARHQNALPNGCS